MTAPGAANAPAPTGTTSSIASGASLSTVQAAIGGAAPGTTLVFPADTDLHITSEITLADGVSLYGLPGAKFTAAQTSGTNCFHATGISDVAISGFICDGGVDGGGGTSLNAFFFVEAACSNIHVEWNDFQGNFNQSDLYMFNSDEVYFRKNVCGANEFQPVSQHHTDGATTHASIFVTDNEITAYARMAIECVFNVQVEYHIDRNTISGQVVPKALGGGIAVSIVNDYGDDPSDATPNEQGTIWGNDISGDTVPIEIALENMTIKENVTSTTSGWFISACPGSVIESNDITVTVTDPFQEDGGYDGSEWIGTNTVNGSSSSGWSGHGPYGAKPDVFAASDEPSGGGGGPTVGVVSPSSVSSAGGSTVVLTGTGFTDATDVQCGGESVTSFTVDSDTQITMVTAAHAAGTVTVEVIV